MFSPHGQDNSYEKVCFSLKTFSTKLLTFFKFSYIISQLEENKERSKFLIGKPIPGHAIVDAVLSSHQAINRNVILFRVSQPLLRHQDNLLAQFS